MCNQSRQSFQSSDGNYITLDKFSIKDAWNSPTRLEIKSALENGIEHPNCQDCWNEEAAGRDSKRIMINRGLSHVKPLEDQPMAIMLKPGNLCNLACRHCGPFSSSRWLRDYYKIESRDPDWLTYTNQFSNIQDSYNENNRVWSDLKDWAPGIHFYELYGAEPMLIDPLWDVIRTSSLSEGGPKTNLNINTNGTILRDDTQEIFKNFHRVVLGVSVDAVGERFEYMRYPAKWGQLLSNLDRYQEMAAKLGNISISISATVGALNIYYADELWQFFNDRGLHVGFNVLHRPTHLNMRIFPTAVKEKIAKKLQDSNTPAKNLIPMMMSPISEPERAMLDFWVITEGYDRIRQESYKQTFPEMFEILENSK
jgi:MoaA/NifB/PqqE/SkfB family radical SAM enzyme